MTASVDVDLDANLRFCGWATIRRDSARTEYAAVCCEYVALPSGRFELENR